MKTFACVCRATLFFENTLCLTCGREVGWCPACRTLSAIEPQQPTSDGRMFYTCTSPGCSATVVKCHNYAVENVCNRCIVSPDGRPPTDTLCDCCRFNGTIPDLTVDGNRLKWGRLEAAKRRLFYGLNMLGLPYGTQAEGFTPPLAFDFKADVIPDGQQWRAMNEAEQVFTGHADGLITINIKEADDVEREQMRVAMKEPQRTLVGHFRHEIGHYYWSMLVEHKDEQAFTEMFGDHNNPGYSDALERHYKVGPPPDWNQRFISSYATMHPWEDFAETFGAYLDMSSVLDTAGSMGFAGEFVGPLNRPGVDLEAMVRLYQKLGLFMNEMNRAMGLIDFVPEIMSPAIVQKMAYVHKLLIAARQG